MELIEKINEVKNSEVRDLIESRLNEFSSIAEEELFEELCFCLMTANFRAQACIDIQNEFGSDAFHSWSQEKLAAELKRMGHRFWPQRAERIVLARDLRDDLLGIRDKESFCARDFLVKNVKGLGLKESSHFLRNVGVFDVAIIDFHIVDLLVREGLIDPLPSKSISPKKYLEIERVLQDLADRFGFSLAELDLYLWYLETGTVLK